MRTPGNTAMGGCIMYIYLAAEVVRPCRRVQGEVAPLRREPRLRGRRLEHRHQHQREHEWNRQHATLVQTRLGRVTAHGTKKWTRRTGEQRKYKSLLPSLIPRCVSHAFKKITRAVMYGTQDPGQLTEHSQNQQLTTHLPLLDEGRGFESHRKSPYGVAP